MMGVEFFRQAVAFQQKYGKPGTTIANSLQTNATLIDDEMARLFSQYHFLLGCSLDGPAAVHNRFRRTRAGQPTHGRVIKGLSLLNKHKVDYNILTLVTQANVQKAKSVYRYLIERGVLFQQYIPCVEFDETGAPTPFSISGKEWGIFLSELFDEWISDSPKTISVRNFESVLAKLVDNVNSVCTMGTKCDQYFVVEYNGDVYPCDFFVENRWKLGNIMENSWQKIIESPVYLQFGSQKNQWHEQCGSCTYRSLCSGDCLKYRVDSEQDPRTLSWLCEGWKAFYDHTLVRFRHLADEIRQIRIDMAQNSRPIKLP